ncbi:hypothetical protein OsI_22481 [Oryza sativa Indica Group]|uniref:Uncharacterized protein n=1 Tax=Oryza sativa subsp. indica TaxID=39946 RepID=B8B0M7_ORYSI|nr:hypothetical protein OsI_22481 [Oryza sativa Indica Group]
MAAFSVESSSLLKTMLDPQHKALFTTFDVVIEISFKRALTPFTLVVARGEGSSLDLSTAIEHSDIADAT